MQGARDWWDASLTILESAHTHTLQPTRPSCSSNLPERSLTQRTPNQHQPEVPRQHPAIVSSPELTFFATQPPNHPADLTSLPGRPQPSPTWPPSFAPALQSSQLQHNNNNSNNNSLQQHSAPSHAPQRAPSLVHRPPSQRYPGRLGPPIAQPPQHVSPPNSSHAHAPLYPPSVQQLDQQSYQRLLFAAFIASTAAQPQQQPQPAQNYYLAPAPQQQQQQQQQAQHFTSMTEAAAALVTMHDKPVDDGQNFAGLNPLSADDPNWVGHGFGRPADEDFFSSPEWTDLDPSPALTGSLSFDAHSSYDPSPLLTDNYEGEMPELAGMPLFGSFGRTADQQHAHNVSPVGALERDFAATIGAGQDFTLFPADDEDEAALASSSSKRAPQMAFTRSAGDEAAAAAELLRALTSASAPASSSSTSAAVAAPVDGEPTMCASPLELSLDAATPEPSKPVAVAAAAPAPAPRRSLKRRPSASELLPMDAPIQARKYTAPSATSRKDAFLSAEDEAQIAAEADPVKAKRLSNTLAARRSRIRKAQELSELHETIAQLTKERDMWKRRCLGGAEGSAK